MKSLRRGNEGGGGVDYLPDGHVRVGVDEGRHAAVRIEVCIGLFLQVRHGERFELPGKTELFEHEGYFPRVRRGAGRINDESLEVRHVCI